MSYETQNNKPTDRSTDSQTHYCPACGEESEKCYRCTECGRDLVRDTVGGESR